MPRSVALPPPEREGATRISRHRKSQDNVPAYPPPNSIRITSSLSSLFRVVGPHSVRLWNPTGRGREQGCCLRGPAGASAADAGVSLRVHLPDGSVLALPQRPVPDPYDSSFAYASALSLAVQMTSVAQISSGLIACTAYTCSATAPRPPPRTLTAPLGEQNTERGTTNQCHIRKGHGAKLRTPRPVDQ